VDGGAVLPRLELEGMVMRFVKVWWERGDEGDVAA